MSGMASPKLVLDTNAIIAIIDGGGITGETRTALDEAEVLVSIIRKSGLIPRQTFGLRSAPRRLI